MKDILTLIKSRRSIRKFTYKKVPDNLLHKVLEAARWAPSAVNRQPWHFVIVKNQKLKNKIGKTLVATHIRQAPIAIVVCGDTKASKWVTIDCALASQNMMLEAHSLGIGTCFIGGFNEKVIRSLLKIGPRYTIIGVISLGYSAKDNLHSVRVNLNQIVSYDKFEPKRSVKKALKSGLASFVTKRVRRK